jgi:hypothetical protein
MPFLLGIGASSMTKLLKLRYNLCIEFQHGKTTTKNAIRELSAHTFLANCSMDNKLILSIDFFQKREN